MMMIDFICRFKDKYYFVHPKMEIVVSSSMEIRVMQD